jgi:hypothetical protein
VALSLAFDRKCYHGLTNADAGGGSAAPQYAKGYDRRKAEQGGPEPERGHHEDVLKGFGEPISVRVLTGGSLHGWIGHCFPGTFLLVGHIMRLECVRMRLRDAAPLHGAVYATLGTPLCDPADVRRAIS